MSENKETPEDRHKRLLSSAITDLNRLVMESETDRTWGEIHLVLFRENGMVVRGKSWRDVVRW